MTDEAGRSSDSRNGLHSDADWLESKAYQKAAKDRRLYLIVGGVGLVAGVLTWAVPSFHKEAPGLVAAGPVWFGIAVSVTFFRYYIAQRRWQERQEFVGRDTGSEVLGFRGELKRSRDEMARSRLMYQNQASNADRNSQAATILGLIFITSFAAIAVFVAKVPSSRAVFAGVAVVGAAYSAYISKTFMVQRESALERYDRVSFRIELEDAFLLAERIIHDTSGLGKSERLDLITEVFEARLRAIDKFMEKPDGIDGRFRASARRGKGLTRRRRPSDNRHTGPADQPLAGVSRSSIDLQELQSFLLEKGARLQLDNGTGIVSDESGEKGPSTS